MSEAEPSRIGPYEVLAKLAEGGVGAIYLARRRGPQDFRRIVAIKRLHPHYASDPSFVTMFCDEARLAARIHHTNVVSITEVGEENGEWYVVMEYVEGTNLGTLQYEASKKGAALPRPVANRIVLDVLSGLHAAHEVEDDDGTRVNLVHRDVSPQNVLVGTDGISRLTDFGIARAEALRAFETRGPALKGKLEYMSPEQLESKPVDRTTDLFATGIVLWEALTGRRLFPAANQVTTIQRICFDPIPSPRTIDPSISQALERVVVRALERPKARRYPTADDFAEELERAARSDGGIATQREVGELLERVLGEALPRVKRTLRELAQQEVLRGVANLASGPSNPPTQQLPASDPFMRVENAIGPAPAMTVPYAEPIEQAANTEPYGKQVPAEVLAEAQLAAARPQQQQQQRTSAQGPAAIRSVVQVPPQQGRPHSSTAPFPQTPMPLPAAPMPPASRPDLRSLEPVAPSSTSVQRPPEPVSAGTHVIRVVAVIAVSAVAAAGAGLLIGKLVPMPARATAKGGATSASASSSAEAPVVVELGGEAVNAAPPPTMTVEDTPPPPPKPSAKPSATTSATAKPTATATASTTATATPTVTPTVTATAAPATKPTADDTQF